MKRFAVLRQWLGGLLAVGLMLASASRSSAEEEAQVFLDRLRREGLYEMALEYLGQMRTSKLAPKEFQEKIDYEAGRCLVEQSRTTRSLKTREEQLDAARDRFEKFVKEHPQHKSAADANTQLAAVEMERGRIRMLEAKRADSDAEKKAKTAEARKLFESALKVFIEAEKLRRQKVKEYPTGTIDPRKVQLIEQREQAREQWTRSLFLVAYATYEIANTYEPGTKEFKDQMTKAAEQYAAIHQQFMNTTYVAAPQARLLEAKCYQEMGDTKKAFEILEELAMLPDEPPEFRELKNSAVAVHIEALMIPGKEDFPAAYKLAKQWTEGAVGKDLESDAGVKIRFLGGKAALELLKKAAKTKAKEDRTERKEYADFARDSFKFVMLMPGEHQQEARELLLDPTLDTKVTRPAPKTASEARQYGTEAWDRMVAVVENLKAEDLGDATKKRLEAELSDARAEAQRYYRIAIEKWTPDLPIIDLNLLRYRLAYMFWDASEYYPAAVLGEFLARHYPNSDFALQGAQIALGSFYSLIKQTPDEDHGFEIDRMVRVAQYIAKTWPNRPESTQAVMLLIDTAVRSGDLQSAVKSLQAVPQGAPGRGEAELFVGYKLWNSVLADRRKPAAEQMDEQALAARQAEAKRILQDGITRERAKVAQGQQISPSLAAGVMALVQILLRDLTAAEKAESELRDAIEAEKAKLSPPEPESGAKPGPKSAAKPDPQTVQQIQANLQQLNTQLQEAEKRSKEALDDAAQWLDDPVVGARTLIKSGHPAAASDGFQMETYRAAVRVYVELLGREKSKVGVEQLIEVMDRLEKLMDKADDPDLRALLTKIYISLASRLNARIQALEAAGDDEAALKIRSAFETLLERIVQRDQGVTFQSLNWATGMFYRMAEEFGANRVKAKLYFGKAGAGYERILALAEADPAFVPEKLVISLQLRLAQCYAGAGEFEKAIKLFDKILEGREGLIPVQVDAAWTFQQWGPQNTDAYKWAILGDKENYPQIWGWARISRVVGGRPEKTDEQGNVITNYDETFHKARYNSILCRVEFALKQTGATRTEQLGLARNGVRVIYKMYPSMGGAQMKEKYEELLKRIQSLLNESPVGLKAFDTEE